VSPFLSNEYVPRTDLRFLVAKRALRTADLSVAFEPSFFSVSMKSCAAS
jgi:hypothetical protein